MSTELNNEPKSRVIDWVNDSAGQMRDADLFFGHGTANAEDEACWMVSHILNWPPHIAVEDFSRRLSSEETAKLDRLLQQRIQTRKPLAYLTGEAWFAGLRFKLSDETLIPRSPLAEFIVGGMAPWLDLEQPLDVLEVGTGSGCIAAALAWYWPNLDVHAVDISKSVLVLAGHNIRRLDLADRVRLFQSDVYQSVHQSYDWIISNPPYVPVRSMAELPDEYHHEPALGLVAGHDGLDIVRRLVLEAGDYLNPDGWLLVEVGEARPQAEQWLAAVDPLWLEFEHGGEGVFLLSRASCVKMKELHSGAESQVA